MILRFYHISKILGSSESSSSHSKVRDQLFKIILHVYLSCLCWISVFKKYEILWFHSFATVSASRPRGNHGRWYTARIQVSWSELFRVPRSDGTRNDFWFWRTFQDFPEIMIFMFKTRCKASEIIKIIFAMPKIVRMTLSKLNFIMISRFL